MREWIFSIGFLIIFIGMFSVILPDKRTGKTVKAVFSLLIFLSALSPVFALKKADFDFEYAFKISENDIQEEYIFYIANKKIENCEQSVSDVLKKLNIDNAEVLAEYKINEKQEIIIKKISVYFDGSVIKSDKGHINILEEAEKQIKAMYPAPTEVVFYE